MHLFNVHLLAEKLRANTLSETEKYRYLLALVAIQTLNAINRTAHARPGNSHYATVIAAMFIAFAGLYFCHQANRNGDDQHLIERFVCLSVPVSIWVHLCYLFLFYGGFVAVQAVIGRAQANSIWMSLHSFELLISSALLSLHFGALAYFIREIARPQAATPLAPIAAP